MPTDANRQPPDPIRELTLDELTAVSGGNFTSDAIAYAKSVLSLITFGLAAGNSEEPPMPDGPLPPGPTSWTPPGGSTSKPCSTNHNGVIY